VTGVVAVSGVVTGCSFAVGPFADGLSLAAGGFAAGGLAAGGFGAGFFLGGPTSTIFGWET
jgi:hypothetical protein